jgi:para-nitrobenzyl esterase
MRRWGPSLFSSLCGLCGLCASSCSSGSPTATPAPPGPTLVTTDKGDVQGYALATAREFLDIPYAAPPVGDLRWKPPADAPAWSVARDASTLGGRCPQYDLFSGNPTADSEDCLQLNVWTPLAATTNAPVMVFIHGGAFVSGSGTDPTYDGANLAAAGGVVVVTVNYRLGPFGFLAHPALAAGSPSANLGLLDQRAALAWVQRNAAAFGGDPGDVTIFGESAGAVSVCAHVAMPGSRGLFQRALMESGACDGSLEYTLADATAQGGALATALGCTDAATAAACMRAKPAGDVLRALPVRQVALGPTGVLWGLVYGDPELPQPPLGALQAGTFARVPVVLGTNLHEGQLFTSVYEGFAKTIAAQDVAAILGGLFGAARVAAISAQYPASSYAAPRDEVSDAMTDGVFVCPTRRAARAIVKSGGTAFLYRFVDPFQVTLVPGAVAAHQFELPFVFGNQLYGTGLGDGDEALSSAMMGYWTRFATIGDPNGQGAAAWPTYDEAGDQNIVFDRTIGRESGAQKARCDFWDSLP